MVEITKKVVNFNQKTTSVNVNNTSSQMVGNIGVGQSGFNKQLEARLAILQASYEEYMYLCENYKVKDFASLEVEEQLQIITEWRAIQANNSEEDETLDVPVESSVPDIEAICQELDIDNQQAQPVQNDLVEYVSFDPFESNGEEFDFKEFIELETVQESEDVFFEKYAENMFLYTDKSQKRTEEDWNKLSEEEKNQLIEKAKTAIEYSNDVSENFKYTFLNQKMEELQIANFKNMSLDEYAKLDSNTRIKIRHDFLVDLYNKTSDLNSNLNTMNSGQMDYVESQYEKTQGLRLLLDEHKDKLSEVKIGDKLLSEIVLDENSNFSEQDIIQILNQVNNTLGYQKEERLSVWDLQYNYLSGLGGNLSGSQESHLLLAKEHAKSGFYDGAKKEIFEDEPTTSYLTDDYLSDKNVRDLFEKAPDDNAKLEILTALLGDKLKGKSDEEQAVYLSKVLNELYWYGVDDKHTDQEKGDITRNNSSLVRRFRILAEEKLSNEALDILNNQKDLMAMALNTDCVNNNTRDESLLGLQNAQKTARQGLSKKSQAYLDGLAVRTMDNANDKQNRLLSKGYSGWASERVQQHHVQKALEILSRNKEYGQEMLANTSKNSSEDVLVYLANNIKNLDVSLQQEALDAVYASGNKKAIDVAVDNITSSPQVIQEAELSRIFAEAVMRYNQTEAVKNSLSGQSNDDFANIDLVEQLTSSQIASLTPAQRRDYFTKLFVKASATDKIKILEKIPNGAEKKTLFTVIARFIPRLLDDMVDSGLGPKMLSTNLPLDASNKVLKSMINSENPEVKKQVAELRKDEAYDERMENFENQFLVKASEKNNVPRVQDNMSVPQNLVGLNGSEKNYIFEKDKEGNLIV